MATATLFPAATRDVSQEYLEGAVMRERPIHLSCLGDSDEIVSLLQ